MSTVIATSQPSRALSKPLPARIPYPVALCETFGIDPPSWKVLCEGIFPEAKSPDSIALAMSYCKSRNLDIMKRPVHIVPVWNSNLGRMVDTIWPGIGEIRTTAARTGEYAGRDETLFGPDIQLKVGSVDMTFPEWAQVTVYRMVKGVPCKFTGPKVYWLETYAQVKRDDASPNTMWRDRPRGQVDKCAEAASLRAAFPEEVGNEYIPEEVTGRNAGPMIEANQKRTTLDDLTNQYTGEPGDQLPVQDDLEGYDSGSEPGDESQEDQTEYVNDELFLQTIQTEFNACGTVAAVSQVYTKYHGKAENEEQRNAISAMATAARKRTKEAK